MDPKQIVLLMCVLLTVTYKNSVNGSSTVDDVFPIRISLSDCDINNPMGNSVEKLQAIPPSKLVRMEVTEIPENAGFLIVQAHSYLKTVTLSYSPIPSEQNSITGTNVGLIAYDGKHKGFLFLINNSTEVVEVLLAVQAYKSNAPIPGGCNMEFAVADSPFLKTTYNDSITKVEFSPASLPSSILPSPIVDESKECGSNAHLLTHEMYHAYFPERDFSKETYFKMLKSMMTKGRVLKNSHITPLKLRSTPTRRLFATYPGTGSVFVVMVNMMNETSVYVPSFTYGCNYEEENNTCSILTTTFSKLFCASVLFIGLFACFFGHYFIKTEMFLLGFFISGLVTYILAVALFNSTMGFPVAISVGLFAGCSLLILWHLIIPLLSVIIATLALGFLIASFALYPFVDIVELFVLDINYWGVFIGIILLCPMLMLTLAEKANIATCSILGSFIAITSVDHYIGSNLRYIVINTIRRATVENFNYAVIDLPYQLNDLILSFAWILLLVTGVALQRFLTRNKAPFPAPRNPVLLIFRRLRGPSVRDRNEVSPLIKHGTDNVYYGGMPLRD